MGHGTRRERSLSGHRPAIGGRCVERIRGQALLAMRLNFRGRLVCGGPSIRVRPAPKRAPDALGRPLWISAKAVGNSRSPEPVSLSIWGSATDSWRTAQTRNLRRPNHSCNRRFAKNTFMSRGTTVTIPKPLKIKGSRCNASRHEKRRLLKRLSRAFSCFVIFLFEGGGCSTRRLAMECFGFPFPLLSRPQPQELRCRRRPHARRIGLLISRRSIRMSAGIFGRPTRRPDFGANMLSTMPTDYCLRLQDRSASNTLGARR